MTLFRLLLACDICQQPARANRALARDHCHASGVSRGRLCHRCNMALGLFADNAVWLRAAADYLDFHRNYPPSDVYKLARELRGLLPKNGPPSEAVKRWAEKRMESRRTAKAGA
jgi:hypothetical protein